MLNILLVDDDALVREVAFRLLIALGHRVAVTGLPQEALMLAAGDPSFDVLVTDLHFPGGGDGRDLALRLRARQPALEVIFVSGQAEVDLSGPFAALQGAGFVGKPFRKRQFEEALRSLCGPSV